jgi:hypothetical protein
MDDMEENHKTNGWIEYKERVIYQLEELGKKTDSIEKKLDTLHEDVVVLKVKAGFYGAFGSFVVVIIIELMKALITHGKII